MLWKWEGEGIFLPHGPKIRSTRESNPGRGCATERPRPTELANLGETTTFESSAHKNFFLKVRLRLLVQQYVKPNGRDENIKREQRIITTSGRANYHINSMIKHQSIASSVHHHTWRWGPTLLLVSGFLKSNWNKPSLPSKLKLLKKILGAVRVPSIIHWEPKDSNCHLKNWW